jgi:hypothetical protein
MVGVDDDLADDPLLVVEVELVDVSDVAVGRADVDTQPSIGMPQHGSGASYRGRRQDLATAKPAPEAILPNLASLLMPGRLR